MRLTVIGSGDAFGSGGRFNTCFMVEAGATCLALDFGASSLVAMKQGGVDPARLDGVVLSHLHGDHFAGLPFLLLDYQFSSRRRRPFTILGPAGTRERLERLQEAMFPGTWSLSRSFELTIQEVPSGTPARLGEVRVETLPVDHPSGAPATGVRLEHEEGVLAYSGDTSWTETLPDIAREADLFICECSCLTGPCAVHLDFETLRANRSRLTARRIMLTHLGQSILADLARVEAEGFLIAHDGLAMDL